MEKIRGAAWAPDSQRLIAADQKGGLFEITPEC